MLYLEHDSGSESAPASDASAKIAPPKMFYVVWEDGKGMLIRTIYRWKESSARKLARQLLLVGAKNAWLIQTGEAIPWNKESGVMGLRSYRDLADRAFTAMLQT